MLDLTVSKAAIVLPYFEQLYRSSLVSYGYYQPFLTGIAKIGLALRKAELEEGEEPPSSAAIGEVIRVISKSANAKNILGQCEPSVFHGEAIVTWRNRGREVSVMSKGRVDDPKVLKYEAGSHPPSRHGICPRANARSLDQALQWLFE